MSIAELLVVLIVALVVFGPEKLPELASNFGKLVAKGRKVKAMIDDKLHRQDLALQLEENLKKAQIADGQYEAPPSPDKSPPS